MMLSAPSPGPIAVGSATLGAALDGAVVGAAVAPVVGAAVGAALGAALGALLGGAVAAPLHADTVSPTTLNATRIDRLRMVPPCPLRWPTRSGSCARDPR